MATRDASGNFSLSGYNPTAATTIEVSWATGWLADVGTEITDSLSRDGNGGMRAALECYAGTKALPGMSFGDEPSSGLYRASAGNIRFSLLNTDLVTYTAASVAVTGALSASTTVTGTTSVIAGAGGDMTLTAGSIVSASGAITFGNENLSTTGTLTASGGGALTGTWSDLGTVTTVDIDGGTIDGTTQASGTINGPIAAGGTWTAAATWTLPAITLGGTVTSNGQSFSGTIADLGTVTTVDINGGSVDGATVGANSESTGKFTTLEATGAATFGAEIVEAVSAQSTTPLSIDPANGTIQVWTLPGASEATDGLATGESVKLTIPGTASAVTWTLITEWVGGAAPALHATNDNHIEIWKEGSTVYGAIIGDSAAP